ncbi:MAG: hypothetical protein WCO69_06365 [Candidatus Omnitrophota bacterium]
MSRTISFLLTFLIIFQPVLVHADALVFSLPLPGARVEVSARFDLPTLRGMVVHPDEPLRFDFLVNKGDALASTAISRDDGQRLVDYFLAAMTVPRQDLWVNLSPVERERVMPDNLVRTELGGIFLQQDYILKQFTASLIYPEEEIGRRFWKEVYARAQAVYGTTDIPVDTFNKVWIEPDRAVAVEKGNAVYLTDLHLKVMLESDYLARQDEGAKGEAKDDGEQGINRHVLRDVIIPVIEKEVNEGRNFAPLRQAMYPLALAQWYQQRLKESILNKAYSSRSKVAGIDLNDPLMREHIYTRYMEAYRKGVFNYIKEDEESVRRYFSGGVHVPEISFKAGDRIPDAVDQPEVMRVVLMPRDPAQETGSSSGREAARSLTAQLEVNNVEQANSESGFILVDGQAVRRSAFVAALSALLDKLVRVDTFVDKKIRYHVTQNRNSLSMLVLGLSAGVGVAVMAGCLDQGWAAVAPLMLSQVFLIGAQYKLRRMNDRQIDQVKKALGKMRGDRKDDSDASQDMPDVNGGIDAGSLAIERQGIGNIGPLVSDAGLEKMIVDAPGLNGVIIDILPLR